MLAPAIGLFPALGDSLLLPPVIVRLNAVMLGSLIAVTNPNARDEFSLACVVPNGSDALEGNTI